MESKTEAMEKTVLEKSAEQEAPSMGAGAEAAGTDERQAQDAAGAPKDGAPDSRGRGLSDELREKYIGNPYVVSINKVGDITYTHAFYTEMYGYIHYGKMTYEQAYEQLGFSVAELGSNRALSSGKRAVQIGENGSLNNVSPGKFNGTIPLKDMNLDGMDPAEAIAQLKARIIVLEAENAAQKKTVFFFGNRKVVVEAAEVIIDRNMTVRNLAEAEELAGNVVIGENGFVHMFGLNPHGYNGWKKSLEAKKLTSDQTLSQAQECWKRDQERLVEIVHTLNYVPGVQTMRLKYISKYNEDISVKRVRKLMKSMQLHAYVRKRDAYKHQAVHDHPCVAVGNIVNGNFYFGPRQVVCTDITYVYYESCRKTHYWCAFKDAFTAEVLGSASGPRMDEALVKRAFDEMTAKWGEEMRNAACIIHSDQGSQYRSIKFQDLLSDFGFIQSMSRRGTSTDNSPIESFWALSKTCLLDSIARCKTPEDVDTMIASFVDIYNNERPQLGLCGLTPSEFYQYTMTGIYPLETVFGVKASKLAGLDELMQYRMNYSAEEARKRREAYQKKMKETARPIDPVARVMSDDKLVAELIKKNQEALVKHNEEVSRLKALAEKIKTAKDFLSKAGAEVIEELKNPLKWKGYTDLHYIYDMDAMF